MKQTVNAAVAALAAAALFGCGGGGATIGGSTDVDDAARPTVSYVTPANNDAGAPNNVTLTVTFSKPMKPESLRSAITLLDTDRGTAVPLGDVAYDVQNKIAKVKPLSALEARDYRAVVSAAAADFTGVPMAADYSWNFSTSGVADTTAPMVTSVSPRDGASGEPLSSGVALSFSEAMDAASLAAAFRLDAGGNRVSGHLSYVGQAAVFTPDAPLTPHTAYTATLDTSAADLAGNALAAAYIWRFSTGETADTTPPAVLAVTPAPNASGVPGDSAITVTFDGAIQPILFGTIDGFVTPVSIDYSTNTMTVQPTTRLKAGVTYTSRVKARDLAGNAMDEAYVWSFSIAP